MFYTFTLKENIRQNGKEWDPVSTTLNFNALVHTQCIKAYLPPDHCAQIDGLGRRTAVSESAPTADGIITHFPRLRLFYGAALSSCWVCLHLVYAMLALVLSAPAHHPAPSDLFPAWTSRE